MKPLARPVAALTIASCAGCLLLVLRRFLTRDAGHFFLAWNLILAWLPLWFALAVYWRGSRGEQWNWKTSAAAMAWLLFFPNAPYICTDLIHLGPKSHGIFCVDLVLILVFALLINCFTQEISLPDLQGYKKVTNYPVFTPDNLWDFINGADHASTCSSRPDCFCVAFRDGRLCCGADHKPC
jgi:hypothetical protein